MKNFAILTFVFLTTNLFAQEDCKKELNIICSENSIAIAGSKLDSIIQKACDVKIYRFISEGNPDYKGRYTYTYKLLKKRKDGSYIQILNSSAFKEVNIVEKLINDKAELEFQSMKEANKECLEGVSYKSCAIDDIGISFDQSNDLRFNISLELPSYCMSANNIVVTFNCSLLMLYLK